MKVPADKNYTLLQSDPHHPSLHFRKISPEVWSVRIGTGYRAMAIQNPGGFDWFWIGTHAEYDTLIG